MVAVTASRRPPGRRQRGLVGCDRPQHRRISLETADAAALEEALTRLNPAELGSIRRELSPARCPPVRLCSPPRAWNSIPNLAREELARALGSPRSTALGLEPPMRPPWAPPGPCLRYLGELQPGGAPLARPIVRRSERHLWIDEMTRRTWSGRAAQAGLAGRRCSRRSTSRSRRWALACSVSGCSRPCADPVAIARRSTRSRWMTRDGRAARGCASARRRRDLGAWPAALAAAGRPLASWWARDSFGRLPECWNRWPPYRSGPGSRSAELRGPIRPHDRSRR